MASTFNKPKGLKYTDMAIYIDEHLPEIIETDSNPEVEAKIYEYLYHLLYALAYKAGYFQNLDYYDEFALYGAGELFISMRKKLQNVGKVVRGKEVVPIKSSLNYIKSVLFPLKINFQRQNFHTVLNPEEGQDTSILVHDLKSSIQDQYSLPRKEYYKNAVDELPSLIWKVVLDTPFKKDSLMLKKLYFSTALTLLDQVTLPNKLKKKLSKKVESDVEKGTDKLTYAYKINKGDALLWHLPETYGNYVKVLVTKVKKEFSKTLEYYLHSDDLSDEMLDNILRTAYESYNTDNTQGDI